ncbi:MAG: ankyrin repeat domain-containing protein [Hydrogenophilales bacterium]|nr:ankyrin repeat domain-containing protein [Hydrogenophilales bacterium]
MRVSNFIGLIAVLCGGVPYAPAWADEAANDPWAATVLAPRQAAPLDPLVFAHIKATGNDEPPRFAGGRDAALLEAAAANDLKQVEALFKSGANANTRDALGMRPLLYAARNGAVEMVRMLLEAGADPDVKGSGFTPMGIAALNGHARTVQLLLKAGADVDKKSDNGCTPLMNAAQMNHARTVEVILKYDPDLSLTNPERMTALSIAAAEGHSESLEVMLKHGVDPNLIDRNNNPPLFWAVFRGQRGAIRVLLEYGAEAGTMAVDL